MTSPVDSLELFVIEGLLIELQVANDTENLFAQIHKNYRATSVATGLGAALGGLFGQVANAASLAMYDGEETESFVCLIGDQPLFGTFGGASKLPMGKKVKAVVMKRDDGVLIAQGILSEDKGFVWLKHAWGKRAELMSNFKLGGWLFVSGMIFYTLLTIFSGNESVDEKVQSLIEMAIIGVVLFLSMALWANRDMSALSTPATEVFRLLGFSDPEDVNLNNYQYGLVYLKELIHVRQENRSQYGNVHCYKKAIEDGKLRMA
jgi:hypothetical protein